MQCLLRCIYVLIDLFAYLFIRIFINYCNLFINEKDLLFAIIYYLQLFVNSIYLQFPGICNFQVFVD